jgi:hypothetical protein
MLACARVGCASRIASMTAAIAMPLHQKPRTHAPLNKNTSKSKRETVIFFMKFF